jgi:hypothetical protein
MPLSHPQFGWDQTPTEITSMVTKWTKQLEKENLDFNAKLCSQANDLKKYIETIERLQLSVQELSSHAPIM